MFNGIFDESDVIAEYTRQQALEDGVLIDVSNMAKEAGYKYPVAVTRTVWYEIITPTEATRENGQSEEGRAWDILNILRFAIARKSVNSTTVSFPVRIILKAKQLRTVFFKAICGPGDNGEPVITIMLPEED